MYASCPLFVVCWFTFQTVASSDILLVLVWNVSGRKVEPTFDFVRPPERRKRRMRDELIFENGVARRQRPVNDDVAGRRERREGADVNFSVDVDDPRRPHFTVLLNEDVVTFANPAREHSHEVFDVVWADVVDVTSANVGVDEMWRRDGEHNAAFSLDDVILASRFSVTIEEKNDRTELKISVCVDAQNDVTDFKVWHLLPISSVEHDHAVALEAAAGLWRMSRFWNKVWKGFI